MDVLWNRIMREVIFWMAWIIIPIMVELIPAFGGFLLLIRKRFIIKNDNEPIRYPEITIIIPVYNSAGTLESCVDSVVNSSYPRDRLNLILSNNKSTDNSFEIFCTCQKKYSDVEMRWINSEQGKARALNMALFNSDGKYIINIDSDGHLHKDALCNLIKRFERNHNIHCMTGTVLVDTDMIEDTPGLFMRIIRRCEFFEYCQAFLAGRNFQSELGSIYTLSGAFSAFRKSTILKTQLYNTETVCEDTHITFQVRKLLNENIHLCENAIYFVEPIEDLDKLYTQRQRWQRGEIEVAHILTEDQISKKQNKKYYIIRNLLLTDHTFAFPRMIWYFAIVFLVFLNYPLILVVASAFIIYLLYVLSAFCFYLNIRSYLSIDPKLKEYYCSKTRYIFFMPLFNFYVFWIRFAGIINSYRNDSAWKTYTFREERDLFKNQVRHDFRWLSQLLEKIRGGVNNE